MKKIIIPVLGLLSAQNSIGIEGYEVHLSSYGQRSNVYIRFEENRLIDVGPIFNNDITSMLDLYGIGKDEASQVFIHQEQNIIDLRCFDCIINFRHHDEEIDNPENDIIKRSR